jgi:rhodanese-related sulfurtransferase
MQNETTMTTSFISPYRLQQLLLGGQELALLDVREARYFVGGHLNLARLAPLSTLELEVSERVPRMATPIVLIDDRDIDGPARRAAVLLKRLGYEDVSVLAGGMAAWNAAGLPKIDGYGSLVKAFGDLVRQHYATRSIRGSDVRARQANAQATSLIDARPRTEFEFLSLPGADNYPGTELSLRDWPTSTSDHLWAINCFSRTRGIIGTTTLQVLGRRDVAFVEDGVMQWALERAPVVQNAEVAGTLPIASEDTLRTRATVLITRYSLSVVQPGDIRRFRAETDRTLYVFDLRPAAEGKALSVPGVRSIAGGQLFMHFENLIGTRNARILLVDDSHRLRAAVTAFWLSQLNQAEVFILDGELPVDHTYEDGGVPDLGDVRDGLTPESVADLLITRKAHVVDVGPSLEYEHDHMPKAYFVLASALHRLSPLVNTGFPIVFTSPDGVAARLAARDARERWPDHHFAWLLNGTKAWKAQGLSTEQDWKSSQLLSQFDDDWGSVMRVAGPRRDRAWANYLVWERELSARVIQDPTVKFKFFEVSEV